MSDSNDKDKDTVAAFVDFLYIPFDDPGRVHDIIWSDGPSSSLETNSW